MYHCTHFSVGSCLTFTCLIFIPTSLHVPHSADLCIEETWLSVHCPLPMDDTVPVNQGLPDGLPGEGQGPCPQCPDTSHQWEQRESLPGAVVLQPEHIRICWRASSNALSKAESGLGRDFAFLGSSQGSCCCSAATLESTALGQLSPPVQSWCPFSGCQTALWCSPEWPSELWEDSASGICQLWYSVKSHEYFHPRQECKVVASLWLNLHFPWLLVRLHIFSCLLDDGFALLGTACSYYLLIFMIDLFDFLLTFFVGYRCWEIAPGGRLPLSLVYALLFGKKC